MADAFRKQIIEKFTYSSCWFGAVMVLEGMAEINGLHTEIGSDKHEKAYMYVFSVWQEL